MHWHGLLTTKIEIMNIQDEAIKIHSKYGTTEKANYEIQLLCEKYAKEYHEQQLKILNIPDVIKSVCDFCNQNYHESRIYKICDDCKQSMP